jgi:Ni/Fe-hydrogenase subunit HybB-like protein
MSAHPHPRPVGGKLFDRTLIGLLAVFCVAGLVMLYRFFTGMGPVSNMTDGFTWGIWEPVNVVVFTGIGAGAFSTGLLCYLLNRGEYHPFVRPAVLLGAVTYSLAGASIIVALGRYWNAYILPWVPYWNLASALLEVAICVMCYVCVLWVEVLPAVFDGAAMSTHSPGWSRWGRRWGARLDRAMPFIIALAIVLPAMHQSSLGGLMLIAGPKVHPLWHTALLPTLFLISCLSMGYGAVVVLTTILNVSWNALHDQKLFASMSKVNAGLIFLYAALRVGDIAVHGKLRYLGWNGYTALFLFELALFLVTAFLFLSPRVQRNKGRLFGAALLGLAAGAVYRVDTYLGVYRPGPGWNYAPSIGEITVTVGMAAIGAAVFLFVSRLFPVVVIEETRKHTHAGAGPHRAVAGR